MALELRKKKFNEKAKRTRKHKYNFNSAKIFTENPSTK